MTKRIPLPNGTTVWVSSEVDAATQSPPAATSTSWLEVKKITGLTQSGGDERFGSYTPLGAYEDVRKPNGRNPIDVQITVEDDPDSAAQTLIRTGRDQRKILAWRYALPNGKSIIYAGFASGGILPALDRNSLMVVSFNIAVKGTPARS